MLQIISYPSRPKHKIGDVSDDANANDDKVMIGMMMMMLKMMMLVTK